MLLLKSKPHAKKPAVVSKIFPLSSVGFLKVVIACKSTTQYMQDIVFCKSTKFFIAPK